MIEAKSIKNEPKSNDSLEIEILCLEKSEFCKQASSVNGEKSFKCETCDFRYSKKSHLKAHFASIHGDQSFPKKHKICTQIPSVHEAKESYKCEICVYSCSLKFRMNRHVERVHEKNKPFECDISDAKLHQKKV